MGIDLVAEASQKYQLAQLNREAGKKAKQSTAYDGAIAYFQTALTLLGPQQWHHAYDLTLAIHQILTSTYYSMGEFEAMGQIAQVVLTEARSLLDKIPVYATTSQAHLAQGQFQDAVTTAIDVAHLLGVTVSETDLEIL